MNNSIKTVDLSETLRHYSNEWLALSHDQKKVLGRGKTPKLAFNQAKTNGEKSPILLRAPKNFGTYIL